MLKTWMQIAEGTSVCGAMVLLLTAIVFGCYVMRTIYFRDVAGLYPYTLKSMRVQLATGLGIISLMDAGRLAYFYFTMRFFSSYYDDQHAYLPYYWVDIVVEIATFLWIVRVVTHDIYGNWGAYALLGIGLVTGGLSFLI